MKQLLRISLSVGVSFAILALLLDMVTVGVPDGQRPSILSSLQATSLSLISLYLAIYLVALLIRAYRYQLLIRISGEENLPTFTQMVLVTGVRNMIVDMLPARLGELGYVGLLNRGYGVKLQHCMSSLTIAIAFDFAGLLVVVFLVVMKQALGIGGSEGIEGWEIGALVMALVFAIIALTGLFVITPLVSLWFSTRFENRSSLFGKCVQLLTDFSQSLTAVRAAGYSTQLLFLSVVIRILKYLSLYLLFTAVAGPSFQVLAELPVEKVIGALIGGEIGASLPIPTFMSFGAYEAGGTLVFQLLGVTDQAAAVITMLCVHIWSQAMEYTLGGLFLVSLIFLNRRVRKHAQDGIRIPSKKLLVLASFAFTGLVLMVGSFSFLYQVRAVSKLGSLSAPTAGQVAKDTQVWRDLSQQYVSNLKGFVVFSSNRDGNHDIFKLDLASYQLSKLTDHAHTETYPRISPDGLKLVFSRAHEPWVSLRNNVAWDVYVLDLITMEEKKIGVNGTSSQWLNESEITYLKDASNIVKVNVSSLESTLLYQPGVENSMPLGSALHNPEYSPSRDQFVFTARQSDIGSNTGHWGTAITNGKNHKGVSNGCELSWNYNGQGLFQVNPGGQFNDVQIITIDPDTLESSLLIDLEGEFSHEYWPKDSSNGEYMVFGASRSKDEHEHDTEDYEIFLWKVGSDSTKATRLTFHTGNDNWPDVYIEE